MSVAKTILAQLGGNKFVAMTGAHGFTSSANSLSFRLKPCDFNTKKIAGVRIELTSDDLYTMTFLRRRPFPVCVETVATHEGLYFDQLRDVFTKTTGLKTSL